MEKTKKEINFLFNLINNYFTKEISNVIKQGIKLNILGDINKLSSNLKKTLKKAEFNKKTRRLQSI